MDKIDNVTGEMQDNSLTEDKDSPGVSPMNILIVDDDKKITEILKQLINNVSGDIHNISIANSPEEAMIILSKIIKDDRLNVHLLLSDLRMPEERDGMRFLQSVRNIFSPPPFTAIASGYPDNTDALRGISDMYLSKPEEVRLEKIKELLKSCDSHWKTVKELQNQYNERIAENDEIDDEINPNVLILDNDESFRSWFSSELASLELPEERICGANGNEEANNIISDMINNGDPIDMLICDLNMEKGQERIEFLKKMKDAQGGKPFIVICSKHTVPDDIKEIVNKTITKGGGDIKHKLSDVLAEYVDWLSRGKRKRPYARTRISIPPPPPVLSNSTFPDLLPEDSNKDLMKIDKRGLVNAALDLDGTIYGSQEDKILLEEFVDFLDQYHHDAIPMENINAIRNLRQKLNAKTITYDEFIQESSKEWAAAIKGKSVETIEDLAEEFFGRRVGSISPDSPDSSFFGYVKPVIQTLKEYGVKTVCLTGSPEPIARPIQKLLDIDFIFAMEVEQEGGIYTGRNKFKKEGWAGQSIVKDAILKRLVRERGHSIGFGMGNSPGDEPLVAAGIESRANHDLFGAGLIVNANKDDFEGFKTFRFSDQADPFFEIYKQSDTQVNKVVGFVRDKMLNIMKLPMNLPKLVDLLTERGLEPAAIESRLSVYHPGEDVRKAVISKIVDEHIRKGVTQYGLSSSDIQKILKSTDINKLMTGKLEQVRNAG